MSRAAAAVVALLLGCVKDDRGRPVGQAKVSALLAGPVAPVDAAYRSGLGGFERLTTHTDPEGHFELGSLRTGREYTLEVEAGGFETERSGLIAARERGLPVEVRLHPPRWISGRVVDDRGTPLRGFTVTGRVFESADGGFRDYASSRVFIRAPGFAERELHVRLTEDTELGDVVLSRPATVRGVVLSPDRRPVARAVVELSSLREPSRQRLQTDDAGRFAFRVERALPFGVSAHDEGLATGRFEGHDLKDFEVQLQAPSPIQGTLASGDVDAACAGSPPQRTTAVDGRFSFDAARGDCWLFTAEALPVFVPAEGRREGIRFQPRRGTAGVVITFPLASHYVEANIVPGDIPLELLPLHEGVGLGAEPTTRDAPYEIVTYSSDAVFRDLPAGRYTVYALEPGHEGVMIDRHVIELREGQTRHVPVRFREDYAPIRWDAFGERALKQ